MGKKLEMARPDLAGIIGWGIAASLGTSILTNVVTSLIKSKAKCAKALRDSKEESK